MPTTTHISEHFLDLLPDDEKNDWQRIEYWTYANDGGRASTEWGDGPRYLGLGLLDWVELADTAPRLVEICGVQGAVDRWRFNHPDPKQRRRWFAEHNGGAPAELTEAQQKQVHNMMAHIPENHPHRDFHIELAELIVTAERDERGVEALKTDIAASVAQLQCKQH
jgi:hypothetical protein